jgi:hypothetical protein
MLPFRPVLIFQDNEAKSATQAELPYELLRRGANYEVSQ